MSPHKLELIGLSSFCFFHQSENTLKEHFWWCTLYICIWITLLAFHNKIIITILIANVFYGFFSNMKICLSLSHNNISYYNSNKVYSAAKKFQHTLVFISFSGFCWKKKSRKVSLKISPKNKMYFRQDWRHFMNYDIIIQEKKRTVGRPSRWLSGTTSGRRRWRLAVYFLPWWI